MRFRRSINRLLRWHRGGLPTWYHADYRLPITSLGAQTGMEPRRADLVAFTVEAA